jgi:hypothetical protein
MFDMEHDDLARLLALKKMVYTPDEVRLILCVAMACFAYLYLGMRLAGLSGLAVWW